MISRNLNQTISEATKVLGESRRKSLDILASLGCANLQWYLESKIIEVADSEQVLDNTRPLKYALNFGLGRAKVTLLREASNSKTPDILVELDEPKTRFYVEVRKFRLTLESSAHPVAKITDAVVEKRQQLPPGELGFVAIDNFDIHLEEAMSHDNIMAAVVELNRLSVESPTAWLSPSGVIVAASTGGGVFSDPSTLKFPHFVWVNTQSSPPVAQAVTTWLVESLPDGVTLSGEPESAEDKLSAIQTT